MVTDHFLEISSDSQLWLADQFVCAGLGWKHLHSAGTEGYSGPSASSNPPMLVQNFSWVELVAHFAAAAA